MTAWPETLRQNKLLWFVSALLLYIALTLAALYWYLRFKREYASGRS